MSAFKRLLQGGIKAENYLTRFRPFSSSPKDECSQLVESYSGAHQLNMRLLERRFEAHGFTTTQSKAIASVIFKFWSDTTSTVNDNFAKKAESVKIDEGFQERLRNINHEAQTKKELHLSSASFEIDKLNDDGELMVEKARHHMENREDEVESEVNEKLLDATYDAMKYSATVIFSTAAFVVAVTKFFQ